MSGRSEEGQTRMRRYLRDIEEKTSGMSGKEKCSYVWTYYWYHILIFVSVAALIFLFGAHYGFGNKKPLFTCIIVNQETDGERDLGVRDGFAGSTGIPKERVVIDSDYHFSFDGFQIEGTNESSYEKFFFQWRNQEIDAVVLSESFYRHCKEMGGSFRALNDGIMEVAEMDLQAYVDEGECRAVILGSDTFTKMVTGKEDEKLLLAFPESGRNLDESRLFLKYVCERMRGGKSEEIIN